MCKGQKAGGSGDTAQTLCCALVSTPQNYGDWTSTFWRLIIRGGPSHLRQFEEEYSLLLDLPWWGQDIAGCTARLPGWQGCYSKNLSSLVQQLQCHHIWRHRAQKRTWWTEYLLAHYLTSNVTANLWCWKMHCWWKRPQNGNLYKLFTEPSHCLWFEFEKEKDSVCTKGKM